MADDKDNFEAVMKRLEALEAAKAQLETENKALRRDQVHMMAAAAPPAMPQMPHRPSEPKFDDLPDPALDPKTFTQEYHRRSSAYHEALRTYDKAVEEARSSYQATGEARANSLVAQFQEKHPDIDVDAAKLAAEKVIGRLKSRGLDVDKYVYGATELFFEDLVAEHTKMVEKWTKKPGDVASGAGQAGIAPRNESPEAEFLRTGGIAGGSQAGGTSGGSASVKLESIGDMMDAAQRKTGLFW